MMERDIQRKIKKDLESLGCYVSKYNASGITVVGHPDLIVGIPQPVCGVPVILYVEVKTDEGRLSVAQKAMHDYLDDRGFWVCVARSTEDVLSFLDGKGIVLAD